MIIQYLHVKLPFYVMSAFFEVFCHDWKMQPGCAGVAILENMQRYFDELDE